MAYLFQHLRLRKDASTGESLEDALRQLYLIDAIDENGMITDIGRTMAGNSLDKCSYSFVFFFSAEVLFKIL